MNAEDEARLRTKSIDELIDIVKRMEAGWDEASEKEIANGTDALMFKRANAILEADVARLKGECRRAWDEVKAANLQIASMGTCMDELADEKRQLRDKASKMESARDGALAEVARLKAGNFTEEEFQFLRLHLSDRRIKPVDPRKWPVHELVSREIVVPREPVDPLVRKARLAGYEGDPCPNCKELKTVRSGVHHICDNCGLDWYGEAPTLPILAGQGPIYYPLSPSTITEQGPGYSEPHPPSPSSQKGDAVLSSDGPEQKE